ncbi:hypothetical protein BC629DRAFT_866211 [Irpex lacteus]|nr:hypothetical protein BC629DRAFT_866211 [Irpex lacteus]
MIGFRTYYFSFRLTLLSDRFSRCSPAPLRLLHGPLLNKSRSALGSDFSGPHEYSIVYFPCLLYSAVLAWLASGVLAPLPVLFFAILPLALPLLSSLLHVMSMHHAHALPFITLPPCCVVLWESTDLSLIGTPDHSRALNSPYCSHAHLTPFLLFFTTYRSLL